MPIKIVKQGDDLYAAEVTPPQGSWRSPHPMPNDELGRKLRSMGCDPVEIRHALQDAGVSPFSSGAREAAIRIRPLLQAVLTGEREVPAQSPLAEVVLAYALFIHDRMLYLKEVLDLVDEIDSGIPKDDMTLWAFLRLRRRGWLAVEGETYGLTPEGRRAVKEIESQEEDSCSLKKLEKWLLDHPLPGDE